MLQKLASLNSTPTIALNEAAELLQKHLSVGLCRWGQLQCERAELGTVRVRHVQCVLGPKSSAFV